MTFIIPDNADELVSGSLTDIQRELAGSNPFLANSWLRALSVSQSNRVFDFYLQLEGALGENLPDTATGLFLERWAAIFGLGRLPGAAGSGNLAITGTVGSSVNASILYQSPEGISYVVTVGGAITAQSLSVSTITRVGLVATVTTALAHGLSANIPVTISGANEADYNVSNAAITVLTTTTFTYAVANSPATPATGTILVGFDAGSITVEAETFGIETNQLVNTLLTIQTPLPGINSIAGVDADEIIDGLDQETDDDLRDRLLERLRNPVAHFNVSDIIAQAKTVVGVTRVFVFEVTPALGQVTINFMRDNDDVSIPSAAEVTEVKDAILLIKPANTADVDVIVAAPVAVSTAFTFSALNPDTATMRTAIEDSLNQFFDEETDVGVDVIEIAYQTAIQNTVDTTNGNPLISFTLSAPSGDITITTGEIGTLGTVTFP